jgi:hypothetical protein
MMIELPSWTAFTACELQPALASGMLSFMSRVTQLLSAIEAGDPRADGPFWR